MKRRRAKREGGQPVDQGAGERVPGLEDAGSIEPQRPGGPEVMLATAEEAAPAQLSEDGGLLTTSARRELPFDVQMGGVQKERFGEYLVRHAAVSQESINEAVGHQIDSGARIGEVLVELGALDERSLAAALAGFFGYPISDLRREKIEASVMTLVPESVARSYQAMPLGVVDGQLRVAVAEPSDQLASALAQASGREVQIEVAPLSDIEWAINSYYRLTGDIDQLVEKFEFSEPSGAPRSVDEVLAEVSEDAPIVQVVDRIITQAMRDRASDVHIEPADDIVRVRFRIDGALTEVLRLPANMGMGLVSRIKIMADMNIVERRRPQDGQLTAVIDGTPIDVRVATISTIWGETCVMRILDKKRSVFKMSELGMSDTTYDSYAKLIRAPFGMVLCAGPTGSGKTTTLYATMSEVADPSRNIMTIEDPVEYVFPSINQIQTNDQAGLTFAQGLKSILRQDPDVILVGEIRDVETARIAVQSALTGHFVLSSLHATDAVSAVLRFLDMGIESFLIASSVIAIVGQRLVRRICPACKAPFEMSDDDLAFYREGGGTAKEVFYRGTGCNFCNQTGYKERIGVYELLPITSELRHLIIAHAEEDEIRAVAARQGMRTLREQAIDLVARDVTTVSEIIRSVYIMQ
jgi:type IV pilus assembly protein PilB